MGYIFKSLGHFLVSKKYRSIVSVTLGMLISGTIVFHFLEGWRWLDSFYFCVITLATVGYGDLTPKTDLGKIATIFYIISGIGIFLAFIQTYFEFIKENSKRK
ncbi:MAG: potassium channel family protein [Candidatus Moraniibacteriota bacterium]